MRILQESQYNQGIGKYKLLSATAGVGSIITTRAGYYILVSDINKWRFISSAQAEVTKVKNEFNESEWYKNSIQRISDLGISVIDDTRFINFLRTEKRLSELQCLVEIPHLSLNDFYNTINTSNNPIFLELQRQGKNPKAEDFTVFATHFPKWFKNYEGVFRPLVDWKNLWIKAKLGEDFFSPPRDANSPVLRSGNPVKVKLKNKKRLDEEITVYQELTQINLVLICPNGHLSDIPWPQFLRWKTNRLTGGGRGKNDNGEALFDMEPCCANPELKWSESTTRSEGYASIFIECLSCGLGSGDSPATRPKINLEGINNLKPICQRQKPWEMETHTSNNHIPFDDRCADLQGRIQQMQIALVTGNNVYFANSFSSMYIPQHLAEGISENLSKALMEYSGKYKRYMEFEPNMNKADFASTRMTSEIVLRDGFGDVDIANLRTLFTNERSEQVDDPHEHYRWQEYQCFCNNANLSVKGLSFKDIDLPPSMSSFFTKIQQVEDLKISQVQLDFSRVRPNERLRTDQGIINTVEGQDVFSEEKKTSVFVLPAVETFGEGIFLDLNMAAVQSWYDKYSTVLSVRLLSITKDLDKNPTGQGAAIRHKIRHNGIKHLLIHTFAHIFMRELEFACGYPTASLKERLYISQRMSGVLIYTSEGAEGSMGGLVSQGQPREIEDLIKRSMIRALDCSSDPLCWESDGQGILDLNLAACFSCALVSETACEERNLSLDRRVLIDPEYGFFKSLL